VASDTIVYRYHPQQNPHSAHLPGVPLRDLTAAEVAALPAWLQRSLAACPFYSRVRAPARPALPRPSETKES
jgi:hypothetical protein